MTRCQTDHFVFYMHSDDKWILLVIHVDDIILTSNDVKGIEALPSSKFHLKDWVNLDFFGG